MTPMTTLWTAIDSPVGTLTLMSNGDALTRLFMTDQRHAPTINATPDAQRDDTWFLECANQLGSYFAGELKTFTVEVALSGTPFQQRVWSELVRIPHGVTRTYGELAVALGDPNATRAVGAANGRNPIGIIIPCHRVIGRDGSLTGYAGGLDRKRWLLQHEGLPTQSDFGALLRV